VQAVDTGRDTGRSWLLLGGWLAAWAALAWWRWSREPFLLDDAFISFRYARNLVLGHGLVYNPGERVEGYTNLLWTLFAAGFLRAGIDPVTGARVLGVGSYLASTLAIAWLLVRDPAPPAFWRRLRLAPALLALILPAGYAGFAGTGMETSFVGLLGLALAWRGFLAPPQTRRDRALFAALTVALIATRLDTAPWVALAALVMLWRPFDPAPAAAGVRARFGSTAALFAPAAAALAVLLLARLAYYGELLPNTYYAKVEGLQGLAIGWRYLKAYLAGSPQVFVCLALMAAGLALAQSGEVRRLILFVALCTGLHALYVVTVGGDFMQYRMMFHVYPMLVAAAGAGLLAVDRRRAWLGALASGALAIGSLAPSVLDERYHMESLAEMHRCCAAPGIAIGRRLAEVLPPDTVISTTMAGGIAYYSGLVTIDQLGLTDREVARHGVLAKPVRRGHTRRASPAYLAGRGVNLVIHHPRLFSCREPQTKGPGAHVFIRIGGDECLRTLYLTPTPALTRLFCSRPETFVLRDLDCPAAW
jgi:arabinofuranosyltransferase